MNKENIQIIEEQLKKEIENIALLEADKAKLGDSASLVDSIKTVVWDQFINQVGVYAGDEFIKENRGLTLDLSKEAHYVDVDDFMHGKFPEHNAVVDYKQRYDEWKGNLKTEPDAMKPNINTRYNEYVGAWETRHDENSSWQFVMRDDSVRTPYDAGRAMGSVQEHMDHTIPVREIATSPETNANMTQQERETFANSDDNLKPLHAAANMSKGDRPMQEWLKSERNSQKPDERFPIDKEEMLERDVHAREVLGEKLESNANAAGEASRNAEFVRIRDNSLKALAMALLAGLVREICAKLYKWFKSKEKSLRSLCLSIKQAIKSFIANFKKHFLNGMGVVSTTILTAIFDPIKSFIQKAWIFLKQGYQTVKNCYKFLTDKANAALSFESKFLKLSEIVIAGLTACGAIFAGEVISKGLIAAVPALAYPIPVLGSVASLLGMLMGGVVSGVIGAIAIHFITKLIKGKLEEQATIQLIEKSNEILALQTAAINEGINNLNDNMATAGQSILERHKALNEKTEKVKESIKTADERAKLTEEEKGLFDDMNNNLKIIAGEGSL